MKSNDPKDLLGEDQDLHFCISFVAKIRELYSHASFSRNNNILTMNPALRIQQFIWVRKAGREHFN